MTPSGSSRPLNTRSLLEDNSQTNRQVLLLMSWMAPSLSRLNFYCTKFLVGSTINFVIFYKADIA